LIGRVRHRATFAALRQHGSRARSGPLTVTRADPAVAGTRVGLACVAFAIPRRVGSAVVRNKVRRRLRAIFSDGGPDRVPDGAYLVAVRPGAGELSYRELSEHVHRSLSEIAKREARRRASATGAASEGSR
jgi:ribonuclease P protein component